jgi:hypothetical protein
MQDHETESPKKVGSAGQNREVTPTPMVDCNEESIIEESYSLKKKTEHLFCVIKKSTNAKEAEPQNLMSLIQIYRFLSWVQRQKMILLKML